jgi:hypothetical protein
MLRQLMLLFVLTIVSGASFAQKLTEKHVSGEWYMKAFHMSGVYFDFAKDSIALDPELKSQIAPDKMTAVIQDIKQRLKPFSRGYLKIGADGSYKQILMGDSATGTYTIVEKDSKQYLRILNNNTKKDIDMLGVWKDRGWLYISYDAEGESPTIMMFERDSDN